MNNANTKVCICFSSILYTAIRRLFQYNLRVANCLLIYYHNSQEGIRSFQLYFSTYARESGLRFSYDLTTEPL